MSSFYYFNRILPIVPDCRDHALAVFQQLTTIDVVYIRREHPTLGLNGRRKVQYHRATHMVLVIVEERPSNHVEECFFDVVRSSIRIPDLIHALVDSLSHVVIKARGINPYGYGKITRCRWLALKQFMA